MAPRRSCFARPWLGATSCAAAHTEIAEFLRERRQDPGFYAAVLDGLAVTSRDGASRKMLAGIVDHAMAAWPSFTA